MGVSYQEVKQLVNSALYKVYKHDEYLPSDWKGEIKSNTFNHVGERSIVFRFAHYAQNLINESNSKYLKSLNVDCEYNRNFSSPKGLPGFRNGTYPDFIIHQRGNNDINILMIEFKGWWSNKSTETDEKTYSVH